MRTRDEDILALAHAAERLQSEIEVGHFEDDPDRAEMNMLTAQVRMLVLYATGLVPLPTEAFKLLRESIE